MGGAPSYFETMFQHAVRGRLTNGDRFTTLPSDESERAHTKEQSMEAHQRTELVDALLAEARQMIMVLLKASTVSAIL
jgi:hypothetical protein